MQVYFFLYFLCFVIQSPRHFGYHVTSHYLSSHVITFFSCSGYFKMHTVISLLFFICLFYTYVCIILSSSFAPKHHFHVLVLHLYFSVLKLCSYVGKKLHFSQYKICIFFHMPVKNTLIWHLFPYALAKRIIWLELELRDHFGGTNIITSTFLAKSKTCHMCMCEGPGQMDIVLHFNIFFYKKGICIIRMKHVKKAAFLLSNQS